MRYQKSIPGIFQYSCFKGFKGLVVYVHFNLKTFVFACSLLLFFFFFCNSDKFIFDFRRTDLDALNSFLVQLVLPKIKFK